MHEEKEEEGITMDFFESIYHGEPRWDIRRPQKEYVQLEQAGEIVGSVLDVGCDTGENALYLAESGHKTDQKSTIYGPLAFPRPYIVTRSCHGNAGVHRQQRYPS